MDSCKKPCTSLCVQTGQHKLARLVLNMVLNQVITLVIILVGVTKKWRQKRLFRLVEHDLAK